MKILLLFFLVLNIASCMNVSRMDVYYISQGVLQYYLRPSEMTGDKGNLSIDFTFRNHNKPEDNAICNFSLFSDNYFNKIVTNAFFYLDKSDKIDLKEVNIL